MFWTQQFLPYLPKLNHIHPVQIFPLHFLSPFLILSSNLATDLSSCSFHFGLPIKFLHSAVGSKWAVELETSNSLWLRTDNQSSPKVFLTFNRNKMFQCFTFNRLNILISIFFYPFTVHTCFCLLMFYWRRILL